MAYDVYGICGLFSHPYLNRKLKGMEPIKGIAFGGTFVHIKDPKKEIAKIIIN